MLVTTTFGLWPKLASATKSEGKCLSNGQVPDRSAKIANGWASAQNDIVISLTILLLAEKLVP